MSETRKGVRFNEQADVDDASEESELQSGGDLEAADERLKPQHNRHRRTIINAPKETRDCWLRLKGMSEKTKVVWIAGERVEIVKATMEGVCVRLPENMVQYWNAGDNVNALGKDEDAVDMEEVREQAERDKQLKQLVAKGAKLHETVPNNSWCVTLDDLKELRELVKSAVENDLICGDFDKDDMAVGPDIHTVNEQFIKPRTLEKGGMSWALMKHGEGLKCDLFITHSWNEGIFEFLNKVPFFFNSHPSDHLRVITKVLVTCDLLTAALIVKSLASKAWDERVVAVACMQKVHIYLPFLGCLAAGIEKFSTERLFEDLCVAAAAIGLVTKLLCAYLMRMNLEEMRLRLGPTATELLVTYGFGVTREKVRSCFQSFGRGRAQPGAARASEIELRRLGS